MCKRNWKRKEKKFLEIPFKVFHAVSVDSNDNRRLRSKDLPGSPPLHLRGARSHLRFADGTASDLHPTARAQAA